MSKSPILFSSDDEDEDPNKEEEVLKKLQAMLQGVPPPACVTMCKLSVTEMLLKYKENVDSFGFGLQETNTEKLIIRNNITPLVFYLNASQTSEEIANLSQRIQLRYINCETISSCNVWFESSIKTNSVKKRSGCRNGFGLSPGSRLSHLARRRQIFSCENLMQLGNSEKKLRIEIKRNDALRTRSLDCNKRIENYEKLNSSKRALFQSPEEEEVKNASSFKKNLYSSSQNCKPVYNDNKAVEISKLLSQKTFNKDSSRKRRRLDRESNGNWPRRALTFTEDDSDKSNNLNSGNNKVMSQIQLSLHHKSKLLWAVSVTLKENNMTSKDPQFKTCAAALFMICRKNLGKILASKAEGGTSEKMLQFAREHIGGIFKKLGISIDNVNLKNKCLDVLDKKNDASSIDCSEISEQKLVTGNSQEVCGVKNTNICSESVSSSKYVTSELSLDNTNSTENLIVSISEKENIENIFHLEK